MQCYQSETTWQHLRNLFLPPVLFFSLFLGLTVALVKNTTADMVTAHTWSDDFQDASDQEVLGDTTIITFD